MLISSPSPNPIGTPGPGGPEVQSKSYDALGGATLRVPAENGLLSGTGIVGNSFPGGSTQTVAGGQINVASDGSFNYTPAAGFLGEDVNVVEVAGYTVSVTFRVSRRAIFVKNDAPAGGNGTQAQPFNTLNAGVVAANQAGDILFVYSGDGTGSNLTGAPDLTVERLEFLGEGVGLSTPQGSIVDPGVKPILLDPVIVTGDNVTVAGFDARANGGPTTEFGSVFFNNTIGGHIHHMRLSAVEEYAGVGLAPDGGDFIIEDCDFEEGAFIYDIDGSPRSSYRVRRNRFVPKLEAETISTACLLITGGSSELDFSENQIVEANGRRYPGSLIAASVAGELIARVENMSDSSTESGLILTAQDTGNLRVTLNNVTWEFDRTPFALLAANTGVLSATVSNSSFTRRSGSNFALNTNPTGISDYNGPLVAANSASLTATVSNVTFTGNAEVPGIMEVAAFDQSSLVFSMTGSTYHQLWLREAEGASLSVVGAGSAAILDSVNFGTLPLQVLSGTPTYTP